jgi:hypothetical protein
MPKIGSKSSAYSGWPYNVEWEHAGDGGATARALPGALVAGPDETFANSFSVVYSYLPLAIQGLMGATQEGAVFKVGRCRLTL